MGKNIINILICVLVTQIIGFAQCPIYGNSYEICSDGGSTQIRFVLKEGTDQGCFDNAQTGDLILGLSPGTITFDPGTENVQVFGDLDDVALPSISSTTNTITLSNLQITNGGPGKNETDSIVVLIGVKASGSGAAFIERQGGTFSINGGINPAAGSPIVSINASEMLYASTDLTQTVASVTQNSTMTELMRIQVEVTNGGCSFDMRQFKLNYTGDDLLDVSKVQLWYNGTSSVFNSGTAILFDEVSSPSVSMEFNGNRLLYSGKNYYFITVDVPLGADVGNSIDIELEEYSYQNKGALDSRVVGVDFSSPTPGELTIAPFSASYVNVGGCGNPSLETTFNNLPDPLDQNYILELCPDYDPTGEAYPILFNDRDENGFEVIIRPRSDVVTPIQMNGTPANPSATLGLFGCDYVTIDGRSGGVGSVRNLIIRNTTNNKEIIRLQNGVQNCTIKYVEIQGASNANFSGLVNILGSSVTESNSLNTFSFNKFSDDAGSSPGVAVYSLGDAGKVNQRNSFLDNEFVNIWTGASVSSYVFELSSNTSGWTIQNNHFYQTATYVNNNQNSGFIFVQDGGGFDISNNYFGGTAPNAAGSKFVINGGTAPFDCIYFGPNATGGSNNISNNTISNFEYTTQTSFADYPDFSMIYNEGKSDFNIENNVFGSATTNDDIHLVNSYGSKSAGLGLYGIVNDQATYNEFNIRGNTFGGITIDGDATLMDSYLIYNKNEGKFIIEGNNVGGNVSSSIRMNATSQFIPVYNNSSTGLDLRENVFKNIENNSSSGVFNVVRDAFGNTVIERNQFDQISTSTGSSVSIIHFGGDDYIINENVFQNISNVNTGSGEFKIIFISSTTNGEVKNNTIGASGGNNIVSDKDGDIWGIHKYGSGGVFTCEGNIIQGFEARSSSASLSNLYLIDVDQGVANVVNNQILNCSSNSQITSSNAIEGIRISSASTGHLIEGNVVSGLNLSSSVANGSDAAGIVITAGSGKIESNYIHDILLGRASSGGSMLRGIYYSGTDDWDMYNNVVWLKNNNGVGGFQYRAVSLDGTGNVKFYHNTLKLESSPNLYIGQCLDIDANGGFDVKNNVFQNLATGTSNPGYTKTITALSEFSSPTFENNYHECPNTLNDMIRWGSTYYDVASWSTYQSISGSFEGNEVVDDEGYASGSQFSGKGADLTTDVPEDKDGVIRTITPWVGAYESAVFIPTDTIIMETFVTDTLCTYNPGYELGFSAYGTFNPGNRFIVQISDGLGSFVSPMNLDTLITNTPTIPDTIHVDMTPVILPGTNYRVRVISTDNAYVSNDNGNGMVINQPEDLVWTGAVSTNWFDCSNWNRGRVPGLNSKVTIPNTVNQPLINSSIARCLTIDIDASNGANLTINSANGAVLIVNQP